MLTEFAKRFPIVCGRFSKKLRYRFKQAVLNLMKIETELSIDRITHASHSIAFLHFVTL